MESQKEQENGTNSILNEDFFNTIKLSKKINAKIKKINELKDYFQKTPNFIEISDINNKLPDLFSLLLTNLNENNNNYVLAQMDLIIILGKTINKEESFRNFIKQSLPKLFDKFYLGNTKINDNLIEMFNQFISFKILSIKDYYQYIENLPLEEEDNYRIDIINFLYEQINNDESVLLNNMPKSINELIKKLINDNESDISETASKILNILINRDIEANKKKEQEKNENTNNKEEINKNKNNDENEKKEDNNINNVEKKSSVSATKFVQNIVGAIKKEVDNDEKKEGVPETGREKMFVNNENSNNEEKKIINDEKNNNENEAKGKNVEEKQINDNQDNKNEKIIEEKKEEIVKENIESKKEEKDVEQNMEKKDEKKEETKIEKIEEKKQEEKIEEKKSEEKIE